MTCLFLIEVSGTVTYFYSLNNNNESEIQSSDNLLTLLNNDRILLYETMKYNCYYECFRIKKSSYLNDMEYLKIVNFFQVEE